MGSKRSLSLDHNVDRFITTLSKDDQNKIFEILFKALDNPKDFFEKDTEKDKFRLVIDGAQKYKIIAKINNKEVSVKKLYLLPNIKLK